MKAVFDTKPESAYDDDVSRRYHFPKRYLHLVEASVGDWVVFRQPRDGGGSKAYFAVGRVVQTQADPDLTGHYYALIADFLEFAQPVAWREDGVYSERALREITPASGVGVYLRGRSVRSLDDEDFVSIVQRGAGTALSLFDSPTTPNEEPIERRTVRALLNRKVRDAAFRMRVGGAYAWRCAFTGWCLTDHLGASEIQAAHIWSVADGGPDTVQNGLALSATVHWLFDRHLISVDDQFRPLLSPNLPAPIAALLAGEDRTIHLPSDRNLWPSIAFITRHRTEFLSRRGV